MRRIDADRLLKTITNLDVECVNQRQASIMLNTIQKVFPKIINDEPTVGRSHENFAAKLVEKIQDEYHEAVNDAQDYYNPNVAQDALEDAYDNVLSWINEILIEFLQEEKGDDRE